MKYIYLFKAFINGSSEQILKANVGEKKKKDMKSTHDNP